MQDLDIYKLLVTTANIISQTKFAMRFAIKGGLVLVTKMFEHGKNDMFRRTTDIDIHCNSRDTWIDFYTNCERILNNNPYNIVYCLEDRRSARKGLDKSDSLKFGVTLPDGSKTHIKMDMNIKSNETIEIEFDTNLNMFTYSELTMLSDKIVVVSSQHVYRRIKDLYDLCVLANMYDFRLVDIANILQKKHNKDFSQLTNMLIPANMPALMHAYSEFKGIYNKPPFSIIWDTATKFLLQIYSNSNLNITWSYREGMWK